MNLDILVHIYISVFLQITHAMSSIAAALTAATMGTPADVIKTRVMNQPLDNNGIGIVNHVMLRNISVLGEGKGQLMNISLIS